MTNVTTPANSEIKPEPACVTPIGMPSRAVGELLGRVSSRWALVIFAAKRARQINSYYQEQDEGVFEFVGPLVTPEQGEKPLSIALREIEAGLLEHEEGLDS